MSIFYLEDFRFTLQEVLDGLDICRYHVNRGLLNLKWRLSQSIQRFPAGSLRTSTSFIWNNYAQFNFQWNALTLLPDSSSNAPRLLCLRYYRVESMGWTFGTGCVPCGDELLTNIRLFIRCVAPGEPCQCNICRRQPPILRDMSSHVMFTLTCNVDRLELTRDVTFWQYVYAVRSGQSFFERVVPTTFRFITLSVRHRCCSNHPFHS
jgi:hypothetical protein